MSRHPASNGKSISEPVQCAQKREGSVRYHLVYMMTICMLMESQGSEGGVSSCCRAITFVCLWNRKVLKVEYVSNNSEHTFVCLWDRKASKNSKDASVCRTL